MPTTTISLIRHGLVHNPQKIYYGHLPRYRLSGEGQAQAEAAGLNLCRARVSAIYTSPLLRARQTAALVQAQCQPQPPIRHSQFLLEIHTPHDGRTQAELALQNWDLYTGNTPPYEHPEDVLARLQQFLWRVRQRHMGEHVAAVTHGDVVAFSWLWVAGRPFDPTHKNANLSQIGHSDPYPETASITTLQFATAERDERPQITYIRPY
ncbi:MAG: histidine phosphatase family protein [Chloroflexi bacterium]|nr:histidine phosphatase family protein [Chloroflexota bacterium]